MPINRTSTSACIAAEPEDVFEAVSDLTRHAQYAANQDLKVEAISEGETAVGRQYHSKVRFMGSDVEAELRVTEFLAPSKFCFVATDSSGVHTHEIDIHPQDGGSNIIRTTTSVMPLVIFIGFKIWGWRLVGKPGMMKWYENLKAQLEAAGR